MREQFSAAGPVLGRELETQRQEAVNLRADAVRKVGDTLGTAHVKHEGLRIGHFVPWRVPREHLNHRAPDRPNVSLGPMPTLSDDLRRHELRSTGQTAKWCLPAPRNVSEQATAVEIGELHLAVF